MMIVDHVSSVWVQADKCYCFGGEAIMITICTTEFRSLASRQAGRHRRAAGRHPRRTGAGGGAAAAAAMAPPRGPGRA